MEDDREYDISPLKSNVMNRPVDNNPPLEEQRTIQEMIDENPNPELEEAERRGFPIRDVIAGRKRVSRLKTFEALSIMVNQIYGFVEEGRENWADSKEKYLQAEKNFALTLYRLIVTAEKNCLFSLGVFPPMTHADFNRLVYCFEFAPFYQYLDKRQQKDMINCMENMGEYFALSVDFDDEIIRRQNELEERLRIQCKVPV